LFYRQEHRDIGGIQTENRQGEKVFHSLFSISIGAVMVEAERFQSYHEVSAVAAVAKKLAKKIPGNSLFVERRSAETIAASADTVLVDN